jgi:Helix-turn-helix domain
VSEFNYFASILPPTLRRDQDGRFTPVGPPQLCPELLTEAEAVRYLRLDEIDVAHPEETLRRYRKLGHIRGTQVGKCVRYRRKELEAFLERITETNPR